MKRNRVYFLLLCLSLAVLFIFDLLIGSVNIPLAAIFDAIFKDTASEAHQIILYDARIPKAITAVLCGAALSTSGLLMQTLFRNPLAGPYILGVSSGAGLGVAFLVMGAGLLGLSISSGISISLAAIIGAMFVLFLLFLLSIRVRDVMTLLILGVMIGAIATAIIGLIQYFTSDYQLKAFLMWTLGSLSAVTYAEIQLMCIFILGGILLSLLNSKNLNAFLLGEEYASTIGVNVKSTRFLIIISSGLLAGIVTAFCGPIGFIGIMVPHLSRMLFRTTNHLILIIGSVLLGSCILLFSDILSNLLGNGLSLPINSITALLGIPVIIWIIFNKRKISSGF